MVMPTIMGTGIRYGSQTILVILASVRCIGIVHKTQRVVHGLEIVLG